LQCVEIARPGNTYELTVKTAMPKGAPIPRGRVTLPFEPKAKPKDTVLVFADGDDAVEAKKAGVDIVGGVELIEPVSVVSVINR
jgi:large subunit ribosomal protein L1